MFRFLSILTIFILSCNGKSYKSIVKNDEQEILNLTLEKVVGPDKATWRYHKLPPPPIPVFAFTNKIDSGKYKKLWHWHDSVQKVLDTAKMFVVVNRQNDFLVDVYIDELKKQLTDNKRDTSFNEVLQVFIRQNRLKSTINIGLLTPRHSYLIFSDGTAPNDRLKQIGSLCFSKIAYNSSKDKACIYTLFRDKACIHLFIKQNDCWKFVKSQVIYDAS